MWSKFFCGRKWLLLLSPAILLFLTIFVMTVTFPLLPAAVDRRSSRALSSEFRSQPAVVEPPPTVAFHGASSAWKETSKHSAPPKLLWEAVGSDRYSIKDKSHADLSRNTHKSTSGTMQHPTSHHSPNLPEFADNSTPPLYSITPTSRSTVVKHTVQTYVHLGRKKSTVAPSPAPDTPGKGRHFPERHAGRLSDGHSNRNANTHIHDRNTPGYPRAVGKHGQLPASKEQQSVKMLFRNLEKGRNLSQDPPEAQKNPGSPNHRKTLSKPEASVNKYDSGRCLSFTEQDFPDNDLRRIRISPGQHLLPWLSEDDVHKMVLLAEGEVVSKTKVPAHGQVIQVALDPPAPQQAPVRRDPPQPVPGHPETHSEYCQRGHCSLIKRTDDWFEVFAFHLDRVLGVNRSLPAVLRNFHSSILPYRFLHGMPRPVVWWDPGIHHLVDTDNDQNSVPLSWLQYQRLLGARCGSEADLRSAPCVGIHHSEWGRLALFDFLLQVNDRLDRYCCGFTPDPTELCVENLLHTKCGSTKDLLLVHILVRKADPSRLVFIDNAGKPHQSDDNLNFRLVEGIDQFPERAMSVLQSGCLESLLLRSLYIDKEFWDSQGGASGLRPLIHTVEERGKILLQHIRDKKLQLKRDL